MNITSRVGSAPVSVSDAKANSRVTSTDEDTLFNSWINAAISMCEKHTNKVFWLSTAQEVLQGKLTDLAPPVRSVQAVKYVDLDGVEQEITDFSVVKTHDLGAAISLAEVPAMLYGWVEFTAGYGDYTTPGTETAVNDGDIALPEQIHQAVMFITNHFYRNRGNTTEFQQHELPMGVSMLLDQVTRY